MGKRRDLVAVGLSLCVLGGCAGVQVTDFDRQVIQASRQNAEAFGTVIAADSTVPQYVRDWVATDVEQWQALDSWANGQPVGN